MSGWRLTMILMSSAAALLAVPRWLQPADDAQPANARTDSLVQPAPQPIAQHEHPRAPQHGNTAANSGARHSISANLGPIGEPGAHPHPITEAHRRIYHELELIEEITIALEARAFDEARALIRQHHDEYPKAYDDVEDGYARLADCMERPGPETRAKAQAFFDEQTYSTTRRKIQRDCLAIGE